MAGLFDGYQFDPQTFGGNGLLGLLAQQYGLPFPAQAPQGFAAPKGDYLGSAAGYAPTDYAPPGPPPPPLGAPVDVPSLKVAGANAYPAFSDNAQLPATSTPTAGTLGSSGGGDQNPLMGLLGGIGNLFGASSAQAVPAPGAGQQPGYPAQPAAAGPAATGPGLFDRLQAGATNLSSGGNLFAGLINAAGGLATGERTDPQGMLLKQQAATTQAFQQALEANGVPRAQAIPLAQAAALNPEIAKTLAPNIYRAPTIEKVKNAIGGEDLVLVDPVKGTQAALKDIGGSGGGGIGGGQGAPQMLAQGVKQYNPALTGNDYMKQFGPEIQSIAKMYLRGDELPTGNPRTQGIIPFAKIVAAKYAQDMGIPFSDITYAEKRKMRTDLAASGNSTMGGILSNGASSFKHLAELGESFADLGNYAGPNIPGGAYIGEAGNFAGNIVAPTPQIRGKLAAIADNALHYGQESTKFYAATGGGEGERMTALKTVGGGQTNAEVQAAYLAKEKSLMIDRAREKFDQIKQALGEEEGNREIAKKMPSLQESVSRIDKSIAKLRGDTTPQQGTASQQAPAAALPKITTQAEYSKLSKGTQYIAPDGNVRTKR